MIDRLRQFGLAGAALRDASGYLWRAQAEARRNSLRDHILAQASEQLSLAEPEKALEILKTADPPAPEQIKEIQDLMANAAKNLKDAFTPAGSGFVALRDVDLLTQSARGANPAAMLVLGRLCRDGAVGLRVSRDPALGIAWFGRAARRNFMPAWVELGLTYEAGIGVTKNEPYAVQCYRFAKDEPTAQSHLAFMLYDGRGITRDVPAAKAIYRQLAAREDDFGPPAAGTLIQIALDEGNLAEAATLLAVAEQKPVGHSPANLASLMRELAARLEKTDVNAARPWYERAADRNDAIAQAWVKRDREARMPVPPGTDVKPTKPPVTSPPVLTPPKFKP